MVLEGTYPYPFIALPPLVSFINNIYPKIDMLEELKAGQYQEYTIDDMSYLRVGGNNMLKPGDMAWDGKHFVRYNDNNTVTRYDVRGVKVD